MSDLSRLKWRCRRGVKELDMVLTHYLENHYENSSQDEKEAFGELLSYEDPELLMMLMEDVKLVGLSQSVVLANVLAKLRCFRNRPWK